MTAESAEQAYARGVVDTRLDHHDEAIASTNVLLARTVGISQTMASTLQTLTEARVTDAATRVATAEAVKEAKLAQEAQASSKWTPFAKTFAIAAFLGVLVSIWVSMN